MKAVAAGQVAAAKLLLRAGAMIDARDQGGETALFYALRAPERVRAAAIRLLVVYGAEIDAPNAEGVG